MCGSTIGLAGCQTCAGGHWFMSIFSRRYVCRSCAKHTGHITIYLWSCASVLSLSEARHTSRMSRSNAGEWAARPELASPERGRSSSSSPANSVRPSLANCIILFTLTQTWPMTAHRFIPSKCGRSVNYSTTGSFIRFEFENT